MKIALLFAALAATFPACAVAQTSSCQSIPKASDRLACYDKAAPPNYAKDPPASKRSKAKAPTDQATVVDKLAVENARLDARLKTICRGC